MEFLSIVSLEQAGLVGVLASVAIAVITGRLRWGPRVDAEMAKVEARADRWEAVAIEALKIGAQAGVTAAETTATIVSAMPDPAREVQS